MLLSQERDTVFKGLTRPPMLFGVPLVPLVLMGMAFILVAFWVSFWVLVASPVLYIAMREATKYDDHIFNLYLLKPKFITAKKSDNYFGAKTFVANTYRDLPKKSIMPELSIAKLDKVVSFEKYLPYSSLVRDDIVMTHEHELMTTWKLKGVPFEVENSLDVDNDKNTLNMIIKTFSNYNISFYFHTARHSITDKFESNFDNTFLNTLSKQYYDGFDNGALKSNSLYLTIIYKPIKNKFEKSDFTKLSFDEKHKEILDFIKKMDEFTNRIETNLKIFTPTRLRTYVKDDKKYSKQLEFYNFLLSGEDSRVQVLKSPIQTYLTGNLQNIQFNKSMMQFNFTTGKKKFARAVEIKEYSTDTYAGILNVLMYLDVDYTITQTYSSLLKSEAKEKLSVQKKQLTGSEDDSLSQIDEIAEALDDLSSGRIGFGKYHFSIMVYGSTPKDVKENTNEVLTELANSGFMATLADIALPATYFAQFPSNFSIRPRVTLLSSKNYSGLVSLHNFNTDKKEGNCWGEAAIILKTPNRQPYYFSLHESHKKVDFGEHHLANTLVIGKAGGGKTAFLTFLMNMMMKFNNPNSFPKSIQDESKKSMTAIYLDKDKGAIGNILAAGGKYLSVESGKPSGFNPFMCESTPTNINHLQNLIKILVTRSGEKINSTEEEKLASAIQFIMTEFDKDEREYPISLLLENLAESNDEDNSIKDRLQLWKKGNKFGWVFDNPIDELNFDDNDINIYGIDGTEFLDDAEVKGALSYYILWRVMGIMDGRRLGIFIDEAWKWIEEESISEEVKNKLKTNRKLNSFFVLAVQSVEDFLKNKNARAIVEQSATMVFFTNPRAVEEEYVKGLSCTREEYHAIKNIDPSTYQFLVKKIVPNDISRTITKLDLSSVDDEFIKILSTSKAYVETIEKIFDKESLTLDEKVEELKNMYKQ